MNTLLVGLIGTGVLVYLDDVLIYAASVDELFSRMRVVLERLRAAGLRCKPSKCQLCLRQVEYLGHIVGNGELRPDPGKVEKVLNWPVSSDGGDVASFLGLCNYFRNLIPGYAEIADCFYKAVQEEPFLWTPSRDVAFRRLKELVTSDRVVKIPQVNVDFILETDSSLNANGSTLKQYFEKEKRECPVGFFSRALSGPERRYSVYEREMLAVVKACIHYRVFLLGRRLTVRTDHTALRRIFTSSLRDIARVEKWVLRLSEYDFVL